MKNSFQFILTQFLSIKELKKHDGFWNFDILGMQGTSCYLYCFSSIPFSMLTMSSSLSSRSLFTSPMQLSETLFSEKFNWFFEKKFSLLSKSLINEDPTASKILSCFNDETGLSVSPGSSFPVTAVSISSLTTFWDLMGVSNF